MHPYTAPRPILKLTIHISKEHAPVNTTPVALQARYATSTKSRHTRDSSSPSIEPPVVHTHNEFADSDEKKKKLFP